MTSFFDETSFVRPLLTSEEKFVLSRKSGKLKLKVKSPLFEDFFRDQSKGIVTDFLDPVWGVPLYKVAIDPQVDDDLGSWGVSFTKVKGIWSDTRRPEGRVPSGAQEARRTRTIEALVQPLQPPEFAYSAPKPPLQFNISFLLAKGLSEGVEFPLQGHIPLSLIEGPDFLYTNTLRNGLFQVMKQFIMDYEATIVIQSDVKL